MKTILILRFSQSIILAALLFHGLGTGEIFAEDESSGYFFRGVEVMAKSGNSHYPITSVSKKHIYVENRNKIKKLPIRSSCVLRTEWVLTERYAEVLELKTSMALLNDQNGLQAMTDMLRYERQSARQAYDARNSGNWELAARIEERNEDYQNSTQGALERGEFVKDGTADTIFLDTSITPQTNIEDAYLVACVTYDIESSDTGKTIGRGGSAKIHFVGDLHQGEIHQIRFRTTVDAFKKAGAEISIHLYSGNGDQIALSNARNLKRLTPEQAQRFRNLSQKDSRE